MSIVQRMRAAAVLGGMWAGVWAVVGVGFATRVVFTAPAGLPATLHYWPNLAVAGGFVYAVFGFLAGVLFAFALSGTAQGGSVEGMSLPGAACLGGLAGAAPALIGLASHLPRWVLLGEAITLAVLGSVSAIVTVAMARRSISRRTASIDARAAGD